MQSSIGNKSCRKVGKIESGRSTVYCVVQDIKLKMLFLVNEKQTKSLGVGLAPEILKYLFQTVDDDPFILGKFVGREFERQGFVVARSAQVVEKAGKWKDAVPRQEVLPAVAVIGEMDISDPAATIEKIEVINEIGFT